jgi:gamma-glutamylcyclotransferase (GGCT)/AIG2-like uncharacterized protein YtfP
MDCRLLLVYGSLKCGFALHYHLVCLNANFLAKAKVAAELFDLRYYPGVRRPGRAGNWVYGEVFQLPPPTRGLRVFDKVGASSRPRSGFAGETTESILNDGDRKHGWIYWLGEA